MKIKKFLISFACILTAASCTLDLREDPNAVQPDKTVPNLVLNSMQRNLAVLFNAVSTNMMPFSRQLNSGGSLYQSVVTPQTFDGTWSTAYANILQDAKALTAQADKDGFARHAGMSRVITAYTLLMLVDIFGDVPYSKANQGLSEFNPPVDDSQSIYTEVHALLDKAKIDLTTASTTAGGYLLATAPVPNDLYYYSHVSGSYVNWVRLANSLKLKAFLSVRNQNAAAATTGINALIADVSATGGLVTTAADNFVFRYGISQSDPDSRHPRFVAGYPAGGGDYQSNWLMWQMFFGYDALFNGNTPGDPRMRFYFYRQVATNSTDPNQIRCVTGTVPAHYPQAISGSVIPNAKAGMPPGINPSGTHPAWARTFCYPTDRGYWGRDHVNNEGIPPDGLLRTQWGAYPAGGRFDGATNAGVSASVGMRGAGIAPMMMRSYVQFMLCEAALYLGTTGTPLTHFTNGMNFSFADTRAWATTGAFSGISSTASPNEGATIASFYPDNVAPAMAAGGAVRVASTGNISALSGTPTIDGVALVAGDRILVKNQTTASQNGIYDVAAGAWTRSTDADSGGEFTALTVNVTSGTANAGSYWTQSTSNVVVGTSNIVFGGNWTVDVQQYVLKAQAAFSAQVGTDNIMNYVAREFWIAAHGNGVEGFNLYRRTGLPRGMQPTLNPAPGAFPRSMWYPASFATLNSTVDQKANLAGKVFWDVNAVDLDF